MSKQPSNKDFARESALRGYDSVMNALRGIILGLEPHRASMIQGVNQVGQNVVSPETYLQNLAKVALQNIQTGLAKEGFMGPPQAQPKQSEGEKPEESEGKAPLKIVGETGPKE